MKYHYNISIIIPVFNGEIYIETAITSTLAQSGVEVEVIVVDDGSTDNSYDIAKGFDDKITLISQQNQGACVARNMGLRAAKGRFIKFLDADDYLLPGALQAQHAHATSLGVNLFSYGRTMCHFESDGRLLPHSPRDALADNGDSLDNLLLDPPVTSAMLYPVEMLQALGGFDDRLKKRQDYDLFTRALLAGYRPAACKTPIYAYRSHDSGNRISRRSSREIYANQAEMFERQAELLRQVSSCMDGDELRLGLAKTIWVTARNCARAGYEDEARGMFQLAVSLDANQSLKGKLAYRLLVRLLGPIAAERLLQKAKASRT